MEKRLYLLDGMALAYRAHFAFIQRPIRTSKGVNTSALVGFTNTLLDILEKRDATHIGVAFDTSAPTRRHRDFPAYKAQREEMPEDLSAALDPIKRMVRALAIPMLEMDGFEADDIIGTLARKAEKDGFTTYMVTPDKDYCQLVDEHTFMLKPGRKGGEAELVDLEAVSRDWQVERPEQVIDILGLWGDASDNIPGIPGIGEKTAKKLIAQFGSIEGLIEHAAELKGKQKENVIEYADQARLSRSLATIDLDVPVNCSWEDLAISEKNTTDLQALCTEFELNAIGQKLLGSGFKAGRGAASTSLELPLEDASDHQEASPITPSLKRLEDVPHDYTWIQDLEAWKKHVEELSQLSTFCFDLETTSLDPAQARILGIAFCHKAGEASYASLPQSTEANREWLEVLRPVLESPDICKVGHNLKYDAGVLLWNGITLRGTLLDTMLMHALIEPDQRHGMDYLSERFLGYTPISIKNLIGERGQEQLPMESVDPARVAEYAAEDADVTWQLNARIQPELEKSGQASLYHDIEAPLLMALVQMEHEGIRVDAAALRQYGVELAQAMERLEAEVHELAEGPFNLKSPKQLGEVLFERLKLLEKPKKTRTGQYATNEQTLQGLVNVHPVIGKILEHRAVTKLKSTYADALPESIHPKTGRIHTTFHQAVTATGRLNSQNPNLQNIPIRTELGREIRRAFVPRNEDFVLLSADYSQIELRIIAALSRDPAMMEAFEKGEDIHQSTASRVFGVPPEEVTSEMRRRAKMVNFGIAYGISAFGLSQRLNIPRGEARDIIEAYWQQYPAIRTYLDGTIEFAKKNGYVETLLGRRRYLPDITSSNATTRSGAERNAINAPIQGTAADMIKIAMSRIHDLIEKGGYRSRMLLQVHDELVFDLHREEQETLPSQIVQAMETAIELPVPILVETGTGQNWLEAH